ncbi:MAG: hypothetical protein HQM16_07450 [Deltaproteobacteria bacterium]|nr:hypothetical protein [Deltaproteobacteria bacterium]
MADGPTTCTNPIACTIQPVQQLAAADPAGLGVAPAAPAAVPTAPVPAEGGGTTPTGFESQVVIDPKLGLRAVEQAEVKLLFKNKTPGVFRVWKQVDADPFGAGVSTFVAATFTLAEGCKVYFTKSAGMNGGIAAIRAAHQLICDVEKNPPQTQTCAASDAVGVNIDANVGEVAVAAQEAAKDFLREAGINGRVGLWRLPAAPELGLGSDFFQAGIEYDGRVFKIKLPADTGEIALIEATRCLIKQIRDSRVQEGQVQASR